MVRFCFKCQDPKPLLIRFFVLELTCNTGDMASSSNMGERKLASRLQKLGTETAYNVAAEAGELSKTGKVVYPFHIGTATA